eukprot:4439810-Pyramimonas_sp.AAC.1
MREGRTPPVVGAPSTVRGPDRQPLSAPDRPRRDETCPFALEDAEKVFQFDADNVNALCTRAAVHFTLGYAAV